MKKPQETELTGLYESAGQNVDNIAQESELARSDSYDTQSDSFTL
jgi:hypothetical protein